MTAKLDHSDDLKRSSNTEKSHVMEKTSTFLPVCQRLEESCLKFSSVVLMPLLRVFLYRWYHVCRRSKTLALSVCSCARHRYPVKRQSKTKRFRDHRQERSDTESQEDDWNILQADVWNLDARNKHEGRRLDEDKAPYLACWASQFLSFFLL